MRAHSHLTGGAVMAAVGFDDLAVVTVSDSYLEKMKASGTHTDTQILLNQR